MKTRLSHANIPSCAWVALTLLFLLLTPACGQFPNLPPTPTVTDKGDLLIKPQADSVYAGDNSYNTQANDTAQTKQLAQSALIGGKATFNVRAQNDGAQKGSFKLCCTAIGTGWDVKYFDGATDITAAMTGTGFEVLDLAPSFVKEIRVEMMPKGDNATATAQAVVYVIPATAQVLEDNRLDKVIAEATLTQGGGGTQPAQQLADLMSALPTETTWFGENVYGIGTQHYRTAPRPVEAMSVMILRIVNNRPKATKFILYEETPTIGAESHYYDAVTGGNDITKDVADYAKGYDLGTMQPGAIREIRCEVLNPTLKAGTAHVHVNVDITETYRSIDDCYHFYFTYEELKILQPDLIVKKPGTTIEVGQNVYDNSRGQQAVNGETEIGTPIAYWVKVQNDAKKTASFLVTGTKARDGWLVKFFDEADTDLTAAISGTGWKTNSLTPGASTMIKVEVTPTAAVANGAALYAGVTAKSMEGSVRSDGLTMTTTAKPRPLVKAYQPDVAIHAIVSEELKGGHIYNLDDEQTAEMGVPRNAPAVYEVMVRNDGNTADALTLFGIGDKDGWTVTYYDCVKGGNDITAAVTGTGWTTPSLEPCGFTVIRMEATPSITVPWETCTPLRLSALSKTQPEKGDSVVAASTCGDKVISAVKLRMTPDTDLVVNQPVALNALPVGGRLVEYRYFVYDGKGWTQLRAYDTDRNATWTPKVPGTYAVLVWAREVGSKQNYDVNGTIWFIPVKAR
jgi:hypothetical protein